MSELFNENINLNNLFSSDTQLIFSPPKIDFISNELLFESKEDSPPKKHIKFISTKKESPIVNLLQKKIRKKEDENPHDDNLRGGRWSKEEQYRFAEAVLKYGNDWKKIQNHVFSRNITQVRSHAQKYLMKLKENNFLKDKGIKQNLSWIKTMNYLKDVLTYDELKDVLFSVVQNEIKKNEKSKDDERKKNIKNNKKRIEDTNNCTDKEINNNRDEQYNNNYINLDCEEEKYYLKNKMMEEKEEKEEKEILQKFIECFNSSYGEITLNSSFEENKDDINENEAEYSFFNEDPIKYNRFL
jgi:SHAQKYF class myb-like DNA-binding protein